MRDQEERQKRARHSKTTIRVKLPDQTMVQAVFSPDEPVSSLYEWLRSTLKSPLEFELCMLPTFNRDLVAHFSPLSLKNLFFATLSFLPVVTPPRKTLPDISLALYDIGLVPAALVFLAWKGDVNPGSLLRNLSLVFIFLTGIVDYTESRQLKEEMYDRIQDLHIPESMITREEQGKVDEAALKRLRKKMEGGVSDNDEGKSSSSSSSATPSASQQGGKSTPKWFKSS